jgi:dienelactone hydrolase
LSGSDLLENAGSRVRPTTANQATTNRIPSMNRFFSAVSALILSVSAFGAVEVVDLPVSIGGKTYTGRLALPGTPGTHAAVLVVHEWWGRNAYVESRARELAELGYVALAADCYGEAASDDFPTAVARSKPFYATPGLFAERLLPAVAALRARPEVDPTKVSAIGFCFGGSAVLQLARGGADLTNVVSFHGGLGTAAPAAKGAVKARIVVCHGGADPFVPATDVAAFAQEMLNAGAAWEFHSFPGAVHAFTNPHAGEGATNVPAGVPFAQAAHYDQAAEQGSLAVMRAVLAGH